MLSPDQVTSEHHEQVRAVQVTPDPPPDFVAFWQSVVEELAALPLDLTLKEGEWEATSLGGRRIGGTFTCPPGQWDRPRPQWLHGHGYGTVEGSIPFSVHNDPEWIAVTVDTRGYGRSRLPDDPGIPGWVIHGIADRHAYILRGAVADWIRAVQVARSLPGADPRLTLLAGGSLGGGLATLAAPWIPDLLGLFISVPTFGAYDLRAKLVRKGSGAEVNQHMAALSESEKAQVRQNLRYFDAVNAAPLIKVPTVVGLGVIDEVVPGETVAAIYHALGAPAKTLLSYACSHSTHPLTQEWNAYHAHGRQWARSLVEERHQEVGR